MWARSTNESWPRLEDALNDLAADGWEIQCPPIKSSTDDRDSEHMLILRHSTCDQAEDYSQQINRQERRLSLARKRLEEHSGSDISRVTVRQEVEDHEKRLEKMRSELEDALQ